MDPIIAIPSSCEIRDMNRFLQEEDSATDIHRRLCDKVISDNSVRNWCRKFRDVVTYTSVRCCRSPQTKFNKIDPSHAGKDNLKDGCEKQDLEATGFCIECWRELTDVRNRRRML